MLVPYTGVNNANFDTSAKVPHLMQLGYAGCDVRRVLSSVGCILVDIQRLGLELDPNIGPDLSNIR